MKIFLLLAAIFTGLATFSVNAQDSTPEATEEKTEQVEATEEAATETPAEEVATGEAEEAAE